MNTTFLNSLVKQANTALIQANVEALPLLLKRLGRNLLLERNITEKNRYRLSSARILRVLGRNDLAENLHREIGIESVPNDVDFFREFQIEQIGLYLDEGQLEIAGSIAAELDGMAMTTGAGREQVSKIFRNEADITVASWLIIAEVALFSGDLQQTVQALTNATQLQLKIGREFSLKNEREFIPRRAKEAFAYQDEQIKNTIEFLEAVYALASGAEWGAKILTDLSEKIRADQTSDKRLLAKISAVTGTWDPAQKLPPRGISLLEARRWSGVLNAAVRDTLPPVASANDALALPNSQLPSVSPSAVDSTSAQILHQLIDGLMDRMDRMIKNSALTTASEKDDSIFTGKFVEFDLLSMIANLQFKHTNGFIEITWNPKEVETTILAGRLDERCRSGIGFVFFIDGLIIDATLGNYDAPQFDSPEAARTDALKSVSALFQIGQSIGIDNELASGRGKAFNSPNVVYRFQRLPRLENNGIMEIVTQREKELGIEIPSDEEFDFDNMFGETNYI